MLRPTKHAHPDLTVMNMAYLLLTRLRKSRSESYSDLLRYATLSSSSGEKLFLPSLNFLFLLGLVRYHPKGDRFEYIGAK
ncbi:ABC-three component system middle component 8 [Nioella ostreopsis]|mgnify:CR=1 FL=1|jgi:hypothetical protein|uniref:ABC-three component system middle component 8 n=1 Tax=Nioella ostreopsis TaxID=2448479 RepID=UPI000FDC0946